MGISSQQQAKIPDTEAFISELHASIDAETGRLAVLLSDKLHCGIGCTDCCVDEITVFEIEAAHIRRRYPDLLTNGTPHPKGVCAFLDSRGSCRIYPCRPYVCRTQGLPLQWADEDENQNPVLLRDICPRNDVSIDLLGLPGEMVWHIGPVEEKLAQMQYSITGAATNRVALRSLFVNVNGEDISIG